MKLYSFKKKCSPSTKDKEGLVTNRYATLYSNNTVYFLIRNLRYCTYSFTYDDKSCASYLNAYIQLCIKHFDSSITKSCDTSDRMLSHIQDNSI